MKEDHYATSNMGVAVRTYIYFKTANLVLTLAFQIAVAKLLLPGAYATYAVLLATLVAGERSLSFGLDRTLLRYVPALSSARDGDGLRRLIWKLATVRLCALIGLVGLLCVAYFLLNPGLPAPLSGQTAVALGTWFVSYTLFADADALAQSWVAHFDSALISLLEIIVRIAAIFAILRFTNIGGLETIIHVSATTSVIALCCLSMRLSRFSYLFKRTGSPVQLQPVVLDPSTAPRFALANYASTVVYLLSSPTVTRIVAASGLSVIPLAGFSFSQALFTSLQRVFPGMLILPALEPVMISGLTLKEHSSTAFSGMALVYKLELICIGCAVIATTLCGPTIVTLLSRPEYAPYSFIIPILISSLVLITTYRIFEIIANMNHMQGIFLRMWPLGFLWTAMMYFTVPSLGLGSVLLWPVVDIAVRIAICVYALRKLELSRAFDPAVVLQMVASAVLIIITLTVSGPAMFGPAGIGEIARGFVGVAAFVASLLVIRPIRRDEHQALTIALPVRCRPVLSLAGLLTRTSPPKS